MHVRELAEWGLPRSYIDVLQERGITELNPIQVEAIKRGLLRNVNMVVSSPTASGKTLIAEIAIVKAASSGSVGVYLTPLRALANEKYREFCSLRGVGLSVGITTGDYDQPAEYLGDYNVIVATYERFDSIMRLKPHWLTKVALIVVDEMHNISDPERGPIIEMIVARALKYGVRVIGLSATIGNPAELAKWIGGEAVASDWRPVKLVEGVYNRRKSEIVFNSGDREEVKAEGGDHAINLVLHNLKRNYQTLVFIHNRRRVEELAEETANLVKFVPPPELLSLIAEIEEAPTKVERVFLKGLLLRGVGFHHAGLSHTSRRVVEEAFRGRFLKVVYATPTLAAGVNLPARRVLISVKRYDSTRGRKVNVSVAEYKQMAGRAGRPQYDEIGESIIIDASNVNEGFNYIESRPEPVLGKLVSERSLRIHILSVITSLDANNINSLVELLSRTFSINSSGGLNLSEYVNELVDYLEKLGMVTRDGSSLRPTRLGRTTAFNYLDPLTVSTFFKYRPAKYRDSYILHLITLTPDFIKSNIYLPSRVLVAYEELAEAYLNSGLIVPPSPETWEYDEWLRGFVHSMALYDWINEVDEDRIMEKYSLGPGDIYSLKDTASWIAGALSKISGVVGDIPYYKELNKLSQRLEKGVKADSLELASLRYIGRVRARILIEHGIRTLEDLARVPKEKLAGLPLFGPKVAEEIYNQLREMGYNTNA